MGKSKVRQRCMNCTNSFEGEECPNCRGKRRCKWETRFHDLAVRTWQVIGPDTLESMGRKEVDAETVIQVVSDCDHMAAYGEDMETYRWWLAQTPKKQVELMMDAFPDAVYSD